MRVNHDFINTNIFCWNLYYLILQLLEINTIRYLLLTLVLRFDKSGNNMLFLVRTSFGMIVLPWKI